MDEVLCGVQGVAEEAAIKRFSAVSVRMGVAGVGKKQKLHFSAKMLPLNLRGGIEVQ